MSRQSRTELALAAIAAMYLFYLIIYSATAPGLMLPLRIDLAILSALLVAAFAVLLQRAKADALARIAGMVSRSETALLALRLAAMREAAGPPPEPGNGGQRIPVGARDGLDQFMGEAAEAYELGRRAGLAERDLPHHSPIDDQPRSEDQG